MTALFTTALSSTGVSRAGIQSVRVPAEGQLISGVYQAWAPPQWGQPTDVDTGAWNTNPHWHVYTASSCMPPASRRRRLTGVLSVRHSRSR